MASIYRRGETWYIKFREGGEWRYKSLRTRNEREAQAIKKRVNRAEGLANRTARPRANANLGDLWEIYQSWAATHLAPPTQDIIRYHWEKFIAFSAATHPRQLTMAVVEDWKKTRVEAGDAPRSINNGLKDVRAVFNRLKALGAYTGRNPVDGVVRLKIPRTMPTHHTVEERDGLLEAATKQGQAIEWVVLLGAWAGLRKKEIVNARWEWFDWDPQEPKIRVMRGEGFEVKDYEDRTVPMAQRIRAALRPHAKAKGYLFEQAEWNKGKSRYRFEAKKGLVAALTAAGLEEDSPYQKLRHTFGSILAQQGVSIYKIAEWMGHESVSTTRRHYAALQAYDEDIEALG